MRHSNGTPFHQRTLFVNATYFIYFAAASFIPAVAGLQHVQK
jgi:hypothetical protein